jgi:hypothetical protein
MPDWGFAPATGKPASGERNLLLVSYRGDRPPLGDTAISALQTFAADRGLAIVVVTQVGRDEDRTSELAAQLKAPTLGWPEGVSHADQERRLRALFQRAAVVASDRLHVLIVGATEGAIPVNLVEEPDVKVVRHFDVIGYHSLSIVVNDAGVEELVAGLTAQAARVTELNLAVDQARQEIARMTAEALSLTNSEAPRVG